MRDVETISLAVTAAETGHLVFATLHTNNAAESVDRMVDVFPPEQQEQIRVQLSNNLIAIIAQQLLPKAQGKGRVACNEVMLASSGDPQPHSRGQDAPDQLDDPNERQPRACSPWTRTCATATCPGLITLEDAMARCQNVEELKKMINAPAGSPGRAGRGRRSGSEINDHACLQLHVPGCQRRHPERNRRCREAKMS